jgi:hypothetical protein
MALDATGNLFASNTTGGADLTGSITKYDTPLTNGEAASFSLVQSSEAADPIGIAFDAAGNLYVADNKSGASGLVEYPAPVTAATTGITVQSSELDRSSFIAITKGNVLVITP